jgi:hypothetical protein|tara:strand:+ start:1609 stop:1842 length:234 start_codon:yes stop_codon:yes gene_type:complete
MAKLEESVRLNSVAFKEGFMFKEGKDTLRRELSRIRKRIRFNQLCGCVRTGFANENRRKKLRISTELGFRKALFRFT